MFVGKDRTEVVWIDLSVAGIPLFRIDVPPSSDRVRFFTEFSGTESDYHVELVKVFRPPDLPPSKDFGSSEILEVFMVGDNIDGISGTFEVMPPRFESFKNSEKLFIVGVVVEFGSLESPR